MGANHDMVAQTVRMQPGESGPRNWPWARPCTVLLLVGLSACGHSPLAPTERVNGAWRGTIESATDGPGTIDLQLTQSGPNVDGTVVLSQATITDVPGTFIGTLATSSSPTTMEFVVRYEYGPFQCEGSFSGTLTVDGREIEGAFSGENCVQQFNGRVRATKIE
jgi:hypothetical protein